MRIAFNVVNNGCSLLNIQNICVKSLLFLVIKSYKKLCKRMMKQLYNSVFARYRDLLVARITIISLCLLATDKSRHFAHPRPIIVNCLFVRITYLIFIIFKHIILCILFKKFARKTVQFLSLRYIGGSKIHLSSGFCLRIINSLSVT